MMYNQYSPGNNQLLQSSGSSIVKMEDSSNFQLQETVKNMQAALLQSNGSQGDQILNSFLTLSGSQQN